MVFENRAGVNLQAIKVMLFDRFTYFFTLVHFTSGGTGTQNPIFRYSETESAVKGVESKSNKTFLQFLPNFCHI